MTDELAQVDPAFDADRMNALIGFDPIARTFTLAAWLDAIRNPDDREVARTVALVTHERHFYRKQWRGEPTRRAFLAVLRTALYVELIEKLGRHAAP